MNELEFKLELRHIKERQWSLCKEWIQYFGEPEYCPKYDTKVCFMKCEYAKIRENDSNNRTI